MNCQQRPPSIALVAGVHEVVCRCKQLAIVVRIAFEVTVCHCIIALLRPNLVTAVVHAITIRIYPFPTLCPPPLRVPLAEHGLSLAIANRRVPELIASVRDSADRNHNRTLAAVLCESASAAIDSQ
jgi:hypothetical protein